MKRRQDIRSSRVTWRHTFSLLSPFSCWLKLKSHTCTIPMSSGAGRNPLQTPVEPDRRTSARIWLLCVIVSEDADMAGFLRYLYVELLARWPQRHMVTFSASICCICASDLPHCVCLCVCGEIMRLSSSVPKHFLLYVCIRIYSCDWFETLCVGSNSTCQTNSVRHV